MSDKATEGVQAGDILADKYRVERVLGQGGMGVVVLAEHIELRERVAIKFLLDTPGDGVELAERFLREARAAVKIKSEHVVRVVDVGRLPTGAPYMVMEYLEGEDLSQRLLAGRVPIEDAVDYVIQGCEAMHAAHRLGIVHRDLKPANLFLTQRSDGSSLIKVLDFGISKVKTTDAAQLSLTHTQAMMGSPLYMSPEQMRSSKDVSPSADIWSLGVILHELIAGDVPFTGSTFPEVLVQVMSDPPPRLRSLRAEVPAGLEAVVLCCLEKNPADRYSSVAALGVALAPYASSRTLGLQSRLRSSLSQPPAVAGPAAPAGIPMRGAEVTHPHEAPVATAPTAPAPAPPAEAFPPFPAAERAPGKTHTAWGEHSAVGGAGPAGARRRWLLSAGAAAALLAIGAFGWLRTTGDTKPSASTPSASAANASAPNAPAGAGLSGVGSTGNGALGRAVPSAAPADPSQPRLREPVIRPAEPEPEVPAPTSPRVAAGSNTDSSDTARPELGVNRQPPSVAPVPARDEHTPAALPTAATPDPPSAASVNERPIASSRAPSKAPDRSARARAPSASPTRTVASAHSARPASPPPKPTRGKPLSIEFK